MTCSDFLKELTDYLDESMDAQTKAELEDHLQWCHNCYVVCNTTKMTIEIYRDSHLYELPDDLRTRLRTAIVSKCECHKSQGSDPRPERLFNPQVESSSKIAGHGQVPPASSPRPSDTLFTHLSLPICRYRIMQLGFRSSTLEKAL